MRPITSVGLRFARSLITRAAARSVQRDNPRHYRAVIFKVDRLGDFVLAVSAIRMALEHYGEERCLLVVSPAADRLAAIEFPRTPRLVLPASVGHKRILLEARRARALFRSITADVGLCFRYQRWDWDELLLLWLGAAHSYVLDDAAGRRFFADRNTYHFNDAAHPEFRPTTDSHSPSAQLCRELQRHQQLLTHVLGRPVPAQDILPFFKNIVPVQTNQIIVAPFGSAAIRDFPAAALEGAVARIRAASDASIVLCGDASQQSRLRQLEAAWQAKSIAAVRCAGAMSLDEFLHAIGGARMILTVETATAHLAAAFDRPAVIAIGGGHYGEFGPWSRSDRQKWFTHEIACVGCNWQCGYPEPFCLTRIDASAIAAAAIQLLDGGKKA